MKRLSVIIPVYNEERTIGRILEKVRKSSIPGIEKEIIIVDDASTDKTWEMLGKLKGSGIKVIRHAKNVGKGAAIRTALRHVTGSFVIIQDADLEYDPKDYKNLLMPLMHGKAKVVYGSRLLGKKHANYSRLAYYAAGLSLTMLANFLYGIRITDEPCGYKAFDSETLKGINLKCKRFEFCPEVTAKIAKKGIKIHEVPASYSPRSREEGKKIKFRDWLEAVYTLVKYRILD